MFLFLFVMESPNRQKITLQRILFLSFFPIVLIFSVFIILLILPDHSLHDLHTSKERRRISSGFNSLFGYIFILTFIILFGLFLEILNISIPNFPLSYFSSNILSCGRYCCSSSFSDFRINCLHLSSIVIEFISH